MFDALSKKEISTVAEEYDIEPAALLAVCWVESAGQAFWEVRGKKVPAVRFEGHYFHKRLKGAVLAKAVAQGLAAKKAGAVANPSNWAARYNLLDRARAINTAAADESTSWGLGQVMGSNWKDLGYESVADLVAEADSGVAGQVRLMIKFITRNGLVLPLKKRQWAVFAKRYNGPNYAVNRYDKKMAEAYRMFTATDDDTESDGGVALVQKKLAKLGYYTGHVDGIAGERTKAAIKRFQKERGMDEVDGIAGPMTLAEIEAALETQKSEKAKKVIATTTGVGLIGAANAENISEAVEVATNSADRVKGLTEVLNLPILFGSLVVAAVAVFIIWTYVKKVRQPEAPE